MANLRKCKLISKHVHANVSFSLFYNAISLLRNAIQAYALNWERLPSLQTVGVHGLAKRSFLYVPHLMIFEFPVALSVIHQANLDFIWFSTVCKFEIAVSCCKVVLTFVCARYLWCSFCASRVPDLFEPDGCSVSHMTLWNLSSLVLSHAVVGNDLFSCNTAYHNGAGRRN